MVRFRVNFTGIYTFMMDFADKKKLHRTRLKVALTPGMVALVKIHIHITTFCITILNQPAAEKKRGRLSRPHFTLI